MTAALPAAPRPLWLRQNQVPTPRAPRAPRPRRSDGTRAAAWAAGPAVMVTVPRGLVAALPSAHSARPCGSALPASASLSRDPRSRHHEPRPCCCWELRVLHCRSASQGGGHRGSMLTPRVVCLSQCPAVLNSAALSSPPLSPGPPRLCVRDTCPTWDGWLRGWVSSTAPDDAAAF